MSLRARRSLTKIPAPAIAEHHELHEFAFSDTQCPDRAVVLELPLRPFSIGHRQLLLHQRNPILWADETEYNQLPFTDQVRWLIDACYTCAQTYAFRMRLDAGEVNRWQLCHHKLAVRAWHKRRQRAEQSDEWRATSDERDHASRITHHASSYWSTQTALFRNYLAAHRVATDFDQIPSENAQTAACRPFIPTATVTDTTGRGLGGPYDAVLIQFLIQHLGLSEAQALEYPFASAQAHFITHCESEGTLKILNGDEMAFREDNHARELEAAIAAGFKDVKTYHAALLDRARAKKSSSPPLEGAGVGAPPSTINSQPSTR